MKIPLEVVLYGIGLLCAIVALLCELRAIHKRKQQSVDDRLAESIRLYLLQPPEPAHPELARRVIAAEMSVEEQAKAIVKEMHAW